MRNRLTRILGVIDGCLIVIGLMLTFYGRRASGHSGCVLQGGLVHCTAPASATTQEWQHPYFIVGIVLLGVGICFSLGTTLWRLLPVHQLPEEQPDES